MHHDRVPVARPVLLVLSIAAACCAWLAAGVAGAATGPASLPAAVKNSFPLGVSGLATNKDGSRTLWVLNTQRQRVVVAGTSIFSIIDVVFRGSAGHKLEIASGRNCSVMPATDAGGGSSIECLPAVEPNRLVPVVTFRSSPPSPSAASPLVELNSSSRITVAPNVALPATARTPAAIRTFLARYVATLRVRSTIVYVTAGKPTENAFTFSTKKLPRGWVTFVVTNRGRQHHAFVVCPNGGLLDNCLASSGGASYAQEYDNTGALAQRQTGFFTMNFPSPGSYEYLSDLPGQAAAGAKGDLVVT